MPRQALVNRGDIVRMLRNRSESEYADLARLCGFRYVPSAKKGAAPGSRIPGAGAPSAAEVIARERQWATKPLEPGFMDTQQALEKEKENNRLVTPTPAAGRKHLEYLHATRRRQFPSEDHSAPPPRLTEYLPLEDKDLHTINPLPPEREPLVPVSRLRPFLRRSLSYQRTSSEVDVDKVVAALSRGVIPRSIPRKQRIAWLPRLHLVLDRSMGSMVFWKDFVSVCRFIEKWRGKLGITVIDAYNGARECVAYRERESEDVDYTKCVPHSGTVVLALGDLGCVSGRQYHQKSWVKAGAHLRKAGCRTVAMLTCTPARWASNLARTWHTVSWDRSTRMRPPGKGMVSRPRLTPDQYRKEMQRRDALRKNMLLLLSPFVRVEPGMIRNMRRKLFPLETDIVTEYEVWNSGEFTDQACLAAAMDKKRQQDLVTMLSQRNDLHQALVEVAKIAAQHHRFMSPVITREEIMHLERVSPKAAQAYIEQVAEVDPRFAGEHEMDTATFFARMAAGVYAGQLPLTDGDIRAWAWRSLRRMGTEEARNYTALLDVVAATEYCYKEKLSFEDLPEGVDTSLYNWIVRRNRETFTRYVWRDRKQLLFLNREQIQSKTTGNCIAEIEATVPSFKIEAGGMTRASGTNIESINLRVDKKETAIPIYNHITITTDKQQLTLEHKPKPAWATGIERTPEGLCAYYREESGKGGVGEEKKLVWFNPGMYSFDDPRNPFPYGRREVEIQRGFWCEENDYAQWARGVFEKPAWASNIDVDEHGLFADFNIPGQRITQRMRWIRPGTFVMGSPEDEAERDDDETQHEVTLSHGYWLADTACTKELWQAVMGSVPDDEGKAPGPHHPVVNVSWDDIQEFEAKLGDLVPELKPCLPTEAQWEHACRAGTTTPFWWGDTLSTDKANYDGNYSYNNGPKGQYRKKTEPVLSFEPNPWGLYQMHGNVWEWCEDRDGNYPGEPLLNPSGPDEGSYRVLRGGSWFIFGRRLRSAYRYWIEPSYRNHYLGFRLSRGHQATQAERPAERVRQANTAGVGQGEAERSRSDTFGVRKKI